ncbi:MAG: Fe-S cluster assembly protein HesB [Gammaproteobacteria bacterium]|nr:MAG: Fe-S cluster assembly protein HesB [Gammaproteobacteria bacterium]
MSAGNNQKPPRVFSELKPWLQEHYTALSKRLQSVAVFVLQNPDVVALNTIAVISEKADVTPSTMVRFAKSIGYQGFSDMQAVFQESMRHMPKPYKQRIHNLDEEEPEDQTLLRRFSLAASLSLERMEQHIDEANILEASKQLANARTIYIAGQGRATPVTTYLHYTFVKMGIRVVLLEGLESILAEKARLIRPDEALLAVSFSPYTANTRELVDICLAQQVPVVAITDSTLSPIARNDDLHLEVLEEELGGIRGLSATMCLALCLAVETGKYRFKNS